MLTYSRNLFDPAEALEIVSRSLRVPAPIRSGLPVRVREDEQGYLAEALVPGVTSESIEINITGRVLTLQIQADQTTCQTTDQTGSESDDADAQPRGSRAPIIASRSLTLPDEVDPAAIEADLARGVLTIRLPKAESALPRRIEIKGE